MWRPEGTEQHPGEIKFMRTPTQLRGRGAGRAVLECIVDAARARGYTLLSLETGTHRALGATQQLYRRAAFQECSPFAGYWQDPHSLFMELPLGT